MIILQLKILIATIRKGVHRHVFEGFTGLPCQPKFQFFHRVASISKIFIVTKITDNSGKNWECKNYKDGGL